MLSTPKPTLLLLLLLSLPFPHGVDRNPEAAGVVEEFPVDSAACLLAPGKGPAGVGEPARALTCPWRWVAIVEGRKSPCPGTASGEGKWV